MNAIVITQDQDETKLAFEVHQNAVIDRLRLTRAKVTSRPNDEAGTSRIRVSFNFRSKPLVAPANILRLEVAFRMVGTELEADVKDFAGKGKKPEPPVVVECAYEVDYVLHEDFQITPDHVKAFQEGNAIFNVWPYFREYLQSTLQRMGLPPLVAPFLRLQPKRKPRGEAKPEQ